MLDNSRGVPRAGKFRSPVVPGLTSSGDEAEAEEAEVEREEEQGHEQEEYEEEEHEEEAVEGVGETLGVAMALVKETIVGNSVTTPTASL